MSPELRLVDGGRRDPSTYGNANRNYPREYNWGSSLRGSHDSVVWGGWSVCDHSVTMLFGATIQATLGKLCVTPQKCTNLNRIAMSGEFIEVRHPSPIPIIRNVRASTNSNAIGWIIVGVWNGIRNCISLAEQSVGVHICDSRDSTYDICASG